MKSKRSLRPSFVLVTSVAFGCGGRLVDGDTLSTEGQRENQRATDSTVVTGTGTEHDDPVCPIDAPEVGSACSPITGSVVSRTYCTYGEPSGCDGSGRCMVCREEFVCDDETGSWQRGAICNPPSVVCPGLPPALGSACVGVGSCEYEADGLCGNANLTYRCSYVDQTWSQDPIPEQPQTKCPDVAPNNGDACTGCYLNPCSYCEAFATCDAKTKTWVVQETSCNPPPVVDAGTE